MHVHGDEYNLVHSSWRCYRFPPNFPARVVSSLRHASCLETARTVVREHARKYPQSSAPNTPNLSARYLIFAPRGQGVAHCWRSALRRQSNPLNSIGRIGTTSSWRSAAFLPVRSCSSSILIGISITKHQSTSEPWPRLHQGSKIAKNEGMNAYLLAAFRLGNEYIRKSHDIMITASM